MQRLDGEGLGGELIRRDEGLRLEPYPDTPGTIAIGYGRNLTLRGISRDEAEVLLRNDMAAAVDAVRSLFSVATLERMGAARQAALISMAHQLGMAGLGKFARMRLALDAGDWERAAVEALDSVWAREQTPARARRMAEILRCGEVG